MSEQPASATTVRIRMYDAFGVSSGDLDEGTRQASDLLHDAGVGAAWRQCGAMRAPSRAAPCYDLPQPLELIVRIVTAPRSAAAATLGEAHLDPRTGRGTLGTLYGDRVSQVAAGAALGRAVLLGRVLAHEVASLLLGAVPHSSEGLMRGYWPVDELRRSPAREWRLTAVDADRIRRLVETRARVAEIDATLAAVSPVQPLSPPAR